MPLILLVLSGLSLLAVSGFIFRKQSKASHCELHDRKAGQAAVVLAIATSIAGIAFIGYATMLLLRGA